MKPNHVSESRKIGAQDIIRALELYGRCLTALPSESLTLDGEVPELNAGTSILTTSSVSIQETLMLLEHWRRELESVTMGWVAVGQSGSSEISIERYARGRMQKLEKEVASVVVTLCAEPLTDQARQELQEILQAIVASALGQVYKSTTDRGAPPRNLDSMLTSVIARVAGAVPVPVTKELADAMERVADTLIRAKCSSKPAKLGRSDDNRRAS